MTKLSDIVQANQNSTAIVEISPQEILDGTTVEIIPAPETGKYIDLKNVYISIDPGTKTYPTSGSCALAFNDVNNYAIVSSLLNNEFIYSSTPKKKLVGYFYYSVTNNSLSFLNVSPFVRAYLPDFSKPASQYSFASLYVKVLLDSTDIPYMAVKNNLGIYVYKKVSGAWTQLGEFANGQYFDLSFDSNDIPHLVYTDSQPYVYLYKYDAGTWQQIGTAITDTNNTANNISLDLDSGNKPYVYFYTNLSYFGIYYSLDGGITWLQSNAPQGNYQSIASSDDGSVLVAVIILGGIWYSLDSGVTWTLSDAPSRSWLGVAINGDGTKAVAIAGSAIFSSVDSCATWTQLPSTAAGWRAIVISADGSKITASINGSGIWYSHDSGNTWFESTILPSANWISLSSSEDGSKLVVGSDNQGVFYSLDSGINWSPSTASVYEYWYQVKSSGDGSKVVALNINNSIYYSSDYGANFSQLTAAPVLAWNTISISTDGLKIIATAGDSSIWTSTDGGGTWNENTNYPKASWSSNTMSQNGTKLALTASQANTMSGMRLMKYDSDWEEINRFDSLLVEKSKIIITTNAIYLSHVTYNNVIIKKYASGVWEDISTSSLGLFSNYDIEVDNNVLYLARVFNPTVNVFSYDGSSWVQVGGDMVGYEIVDLSVKNNNLTLISKNNGKIINYKFDASSWSQIGGLFGEFDYPNFGKISLDTDSSNNPYIAAAEYSYQRFSDATVYTYPPVPNPSELGPLKIKVEYNIKDII